MNTAVLNTTPPPLKYLAGYPPATIAAVQARIAANTLGEYLATQYPGRHAVQNDKALHDYVLPLKHAYMRNAPPLQRVGFDPKMDVLKNALGLQSSIHRKHGSNTRTVRQIHIAGLFKQAPPEFLRMIVVHELAHLKESEHNKAFYSLCEHMEPDYHQLEFDLRLYLTQRDLLVKPAEPPLPAIGDLL